MGGDDCRVTWRVARWPPEPKGPDQDWPSPRRDGALLVSSLVSSSSSLPVLHSDQEDHHPLRSGQEGARMVIACSALSQFIYKTFHRRALNRWCNHTGLSGPVELKGEQASAERGSICLGKYLPHCPSSVSPKQGPSHTDMSRVGLVLAPVFRRWPRGQGCR